MDKTMNESIMYDKDGMLVSKEQFSRMSNHEKHIILWNWLSRNPDEDKEAFFMLYKLYFTHEYEQGDSFSFKSCRPECNCYACKEAIGGCEECPIAWFRIKRKGERNGCINLLSPYNRWKVIGLRLKDNCIITVSDLVQRRQLAEQIRDLPWTTYY
jgi:hypothetical protein